jgi:hypothetical protein
VGVPTNRGYAIGGFVGGSILGVLCAGFVWFVGGLTYRLSTLEEVRATEGERYSVVVASRDLPAGAVLRFEDLSQRAVPRATVTDSAVRPELASQVVNQVLLAPVLEGETLRWGHFLLLQKGRSDDDLGPICAGALAKTGRPLTPEKTGEEIRARLVRGAR